jgi:hypothetical protein
MVDVDDTLNWRFRHGHNPPYCSRGSCTLHLGWIKRRVDDGQNTRVHLDPANGPRLAALAAATEADLAWFTSWEDDANRFIAPLLGLPDLEVIPFPPWPGDRAAHPGEAAWKGWNLTTWAAADLRPFVLLDNLADGIGEVLHAAQPHHLVQVDPATALTGRHIASAAAWLATLATSAGVVQVAETTP